ncbi:MAG: TPR end-of-group domain-containing protein [Opitutales bacterium]|jgi:predicted Zn-dependent protease
MEKDYQFEIDFCRSLLGRDPGNVPVMEMLANYYTRAGRIDEGLELDLRIVELDPDNSVNHYNLACSLALKHRQSEAIAALRVALEQGYDDFKWLLEDPDLENLHDNPSFSALLSEYQADKHSSD